MTRPMATLTPQRRRLGHTDLHVFPLCLGGNVFGWTADESRSFEVLDAYVEAGGNFIDTADQYSNWVPGHQGGESETVLGRWMRSRANREQIVLATKVGAVGLGNPGGLTAESIHRRTQASLERLGVDRIDLLYAHHDDPVTPLEETMGAFHELVSDGTVKWLGVSNYSPDRLRLALGVAREHGLTPFTVLQAHYNLLERDRYEASLRGVAAENHLACVPYWALAKGFLTGKYRAPVGTAEPGFSDRTARHRVLDYLDQRSLAVLEVLDEIAGAHGVSVGAVALAWTAAQPTVIAPIASARTPEQLADLLPMLELTLSDHELARLDGVTSSRARP
jgi:aryl-alcohol dehydrogenase-like predicted oxidoreductase